MYAVGPARPAQPWVAGRGAAGWRGGARRGGVSLTAPAGPRAPWGGGGVITTLPPINFHLTPRGPQQRWRRRLKYWTAVEIKVNEYVGWGRYRTGTRRTRSPRTRGAAEPGRTGPNWPPATLTHRPPREDGVRASHSVQMGILMRYRTGPRRHPAPCLRPGHGVAAWGGRGEGGAQLNVDKLRFASASRIAPSRGRQRVPQGPHCFRLCSLLCHLKRGQCGGSWAAPGSQRKGSAGLGRSRAPGG